MLEFEKMKKCKRFFEKTRKKFILLLYLRSFFNETMLNGDFCFKIERLYCFLSQFVSVGRGIHLECDGSLLCQMCFFCFYFDKLDVSSPKMKLYIQILQYSR